MGKSEKLNEMLIATTKDAEDDEIVKVVGKIGVKCFRGSNEDVLSKYYFAAKESNLDIVIRITSDCPCIDPEVVDLVIDEHIKTMASYTSNCLIRTYPHGLDIEGGE